VSNRDTTLVDANVLLDLAQDDPVWASWSERALDEAAGHGRLAINPLVYAEVSIGYERREQIDAALPEHEYLRLDLPWEAAFLAGKVFVQYRRAGGTRRSPLPDFYIGAHAAVAGMRLLTRDATRYRTYFPRLELISPS
jgi:predicted nucleic acid-binding protein